MRLALWLRYAVLNLRSGLSGFWIFLACLTLSTGSMAVIGSLAASIERGLAEQGQSLLGGDVEFAITQREATPAELQYVKSRGELSRVATLRAMAQAQGQAALVEIKSVDAAYPLYGAMETEPAILALDATHVAVDALVLGRLKRQVGDTVKIGDADFVIAGIVSREPDRISDGLMLGPRVLMTEAALRTANLLRPGSLVTWKYRLKLPADSQDLAAAQAVVAETGRKFPEAGWRVRARDDAASGTGRFIDRLQYFLALVGIASLAVGGSGIANAVRALVSRRSATIATLKCLGLANRDIAGMCLAEIMLVACAAIGLAVLAGLSAPAVLQMMSGGTLPVPVSNAWPWQPLAFAAGLGLLTAFGFSLWPLGRIAAISGASLFRSHIPDLRGPVSLSQAVPALLCLLAAVLVILMWFGNVRTTAIYLAGLAGVFLGLAAVSYLLMRLVAALPRPRHVLLRYALAGLNRPGSSSVPVIMALGLGLSLFVTIALTDKTLTGELDAAATATAPAFFFLDVPTQDLAAFEEVVKAAPGAGTIGHAPMLRGRMVRLNGKPASEAEVAPEAAWALRGDRGLTYATTLPEGSELVDGTWWDKDYSGPPLVSLVDDIATGLGLKIGDVITVNALGRDIEARIASTRRVNWRSLGINFIMVFSPSPLDKAPHGNIVTLDMQHGDEAALLNTVAARFPSVTSIRVKDALEMAGVLMARILAAVRAANALTLLTGTLVLAGAMAATLGARSYESVVLKTYGATRGQLLIAYCMEYGLLGLVAAVFAVLAGAAGAWFIARFMLDMPFVFSAAIAISTAVLSMVLAVAAGLLTTARALTVRPSTRLREE